MDVSFNTYFEQKCGLSVFLLQGKLFKNSTLFHSKVALKSHQSLQSMI